MRLFHNDLISVLPRQQLLGQWRELNSIFKLQNKHILINFVYDYPKEDLLNYSLLVIQEFLKRGYKFNMGNFNKYFGNMSWIKNFDGSIFKDKMNKEYLTICYYNLLEKYRCGGITDEEWQKIEDFIESQV